MRPDQDRVSGLIISTVIKLCEKGLDFSNSVKIQGVIGVTLDDVDTFVVHVNRTVSINECLLEDSSLPASRISSSNNIQEPSSSGHREGAISVGSTNSNLSSFLTDTAQLNPLMSNVKVENNKPIAHHGTQFQNSGFAARPSADLEIAKHCKAETVDETYSDINQSMNYNDEDTMEFNQDIKVEEAIQDIKPNIFQGITGQRKAGVINIPSDGEDGIYHQGSFLQQQFNQPQNTNFHQEMAFAENWPRQKVPQKPPTNQTRMPDAMAQRPFRPAMSSPQKPPQMRMGNAGGQMRAQWGHGNMAGPMSPSASMDNRMALVPVQRPMLRALIPQQHQNFQVRPRIPQQQMMRAPQATQPIESRLANPQKRMPRPTRGRGRARSTGRGRGGSAGRGSGSTSLGNDATEQVVECQSGDGFSFNKQLTVLSRYSCNLCGRVYKNQRSVLHHQSQVHGRPKVKRRRKSDVYDGEEDEEDGAGYEQWTNEEQDDEYYEDGYGEEAW